MTVRNSIASLRVHLAHSAKGGLIWRCCATARRGSSGLSRQTEGGELKDLERSLRSGRYGQSKESSRPRGAAGEAACGLGRNRRRSEARRPQWLRRFAHFTVPRVSQDSSCVLNN